jgi:hypothetical protein
MSINRFLLPTGGTNALTAPTTTGGQAPVSLRDYRHAARIFVDSDYRLSPKYGFLFYVEFDFNPLITNISNTSAQEMGMIVRSVNLPKFTVQVKEHNAYNRKNYVQNSIKYDPVTISFHDDQADNVKNFWYDYYSFYYRDSDYADSTYTYPSKYQNRPSFNWGYTPQPRVGINNSNGNWPYQYIQAIRIYSLYQKSFSEYELINPIITQFKHGEHANGESNNLLSHDMTVQFESVKYYTGYTTSNTVGGYIDLHYDNTPSPIAPSVGTHVTDTINGSLTSVPDTITDLAGVTLLNNPVSINLQNQSSVLQNTLNGQIAAYAYGTGTSAFGQSTVANSGGFALGSLSGTRPPSTAQINAQIAASAAALAGQATSAAVGAVVGAANNTFGAGTVGLVAAAASNPKLLISTAENMALTAGLTALSKLAQPYITSAVNSISSTASSAFSDLKASATTTYNNITGQYQQGGDIYGFNGSLNNPSAYVEPDFPTTIGLTQADLFAPLPYSDSVDLSYLDNLG